jgi:hypothetical protein
MEELFVQFVPINVLLVMNLVYVVLVMDYLEMIPQMIAIVKLDTLKLLLMKILIVNSAVTNVLLALLNQIAIYAQLALTEILVIIAIAILTIKKHLVKLVKLVM